MQPIDWGGTRQSRRAALGRVSVFVLLPLFVGSTASAASCSIARVLPPDGLPNGSGTQSPDAAPPIAKPPSADVDASDGSSCVPAPVWPQSATAFTLTSVGSDVLPPPICNASPYADWEFDLPSKTLTYAACESPAPTNISLPLTDGEVSRIVTRLRGLTTVCPACCAGGADFPEVALTVSSTQGPPILYSGDFYVGLGMPPYVGSYSLLLLSSVLDDILTSACLPDGGSADAGRCVQAAFDAGAD